MKISGVDLKTLANEYKTPLYIYDAKMLNDNMKLYKNNFKSKEFETEVIYASKAFNVKEMVRLVKNNGLSLDCVSVGELYTALKVGFDPANVYFHGNNKTPNDIKYIIENNVGNIVVDNLMELEEIDKISNELNKDVNVLIRINVGVSAHTHKFIVTAHIDSKFGVLYGSNDFNKMIEIIKNSNRINFLGFHSHIGSQIFDLNAFEAALNKLIGYCKDFEFPLVLNIGGGFGVNYTSEDSKIPFDVVSKTLIETCEKTLKENNVKIQKLCIEPGRSIVGEAGYTLYTVGYIKKTPNKEYYFIDGGMTDNIRPALYQAKYYATIVDKENLERNHVVTVAGKCCESGDLIIEDLPLQEAKPGDLLLTYTTGAYGYSMSSNYNKALTPAVVFVEDGKTKLAVRRQTYEELIDREL